MLIDAHTHLHLYGDDLDSALAEIEELEIRTVSSALDPDSYAQELAIAERCRWVLPTFGVHPWQAFRWVDRLSELDPLIARSPILSEIGLDRHFVKLPERFPSQRLVLEHFFAAAAEQDKPVILHTTGAEVEVLELLREYRLRRVAVHWYSGPTDLLDGYLELGTLFTVGVELLRSERIRDIARRIPVDRLLTETDNPGGWRWLTTEKGRPGLIRQVVAVLAELRGREPEEIESWVEANWEAFQAGSSAPVK